MSLRKRLVIQFTGYEGLHPKAVRVRHAQVLKDFDRLWNAKTKLPPMTDEPNDSGTTMAVTQGNGWRTKTEFCQFGTADIFDDYAARSTPKRMLTGFFAFMNILFTGTLWRYLTTSWRFVLFFLWPFLLSLAILAVAALIATAPVVAGFRYCIFSGPRRLPPSLQRFWCENPATSSSCPICSTTGRQPMIAFTTAMRS